MADNKPQDDEKAMKDAYNKGASIQSIADQFNLQAKDVEEIVVTKG